jgi:hypothetical protein
MRRLRLVFAGLMLGLIPAIAEAHGLIPGNSWLDELICLVPAAIMVVLVMVLSGGDKSKAAKKPKP